MESRSNDIEKYLKGELSASEMHALEQKALRDPFLAEALEGAEHAGPDHFSFDIEILKHAVNKKASGKPERKIITFQSWSVYVGIAAGLLLLAVSSFIVLTMVREQHGENLAMTDKVEASPKESQKNVAPATDSALATNPVTISESATKPALRTATPAPERQTNRPVLEPVLLSEQQPTEDQQVVRAELSETPVIARDESEAGVENAATGATGTSVQKSAVASRLVRGKIVSSENGEELAGVNVLIKGTNKGTISDAKGNFEIDLPAGSDALVFSFIGLTSREVKVDGSEDINVGMETDASQFSEMVVAGYGPPANTDDYPLLEMAEPLGGGNAFKQYLEDQLQYPKQALANDVEGKVMVQFTVTPTGELTDFRVLKSLGYGCDEELIRLIKSGPAWKPAKKDDQPVSGDVKIRLMFDLPDKK